MPFQKNKRLTLIDLAKRLKLSPRAVSEALYGEPGKKCSVRVSEKTRKRVQAFVKKLDYRPNRMARTLRTGKSGVVGILAVQEFGHYLQQRLYYARLYAEKYGFIPNIYLLPDFSEKSLRMATDFIVDSKVEGVFALKDLGATSITHMHESGVPIVCVAGSENSSVPRYCVDTEGAFEQLAHHLLQQGVEKITILEFITNDNPLWSRNFAERGLRQAAKKARKIGKNLVFNTHAVKVSYEGFMVKGVPEIHGLHAPGYLGMKEMIKAKKIPDAVICNGDTLAHGAFLACSEFGIRVPEDMLLAGFGDSPVSSASSTPLTSIRELHKELCHLAFADLKTMTETGETFVGKEVILPAELIIRKSTQRNTSA